MTDLACQPRGIRISKAHEYLGVGRKVFERHILPGLTVIDWSQQTITVDRLDLDAAYEDYKSRVGRLAGQPQRTDLWDTEEERRVSPKKVISGKSISRSRGTVDFAKALERATSTKRNATSADA